MTMRLQRSLAALVGVAFLATATVGCGGDNPDPFDDGVLTVVTTVSPLTSIVANIAGGDVEVVGVIPESVNAHQFQPKKALGKTFTSADLVFVNGLGLDDTTGEFARKKVRGGVDVVELGDEVLDDDERIFDATYPEDDGEPNPHLWLSPKLAQRYADEIADRLSSLDPDHKATYQKNLKAFTARIDELDTLTAEATKSIPKKLRKLLTYHDAYTYLARDYGLTVVDTIQPATLKEPSPKQTAKAIAAGNKAKVPAVFGSVEFPSPTVEFVVAGTKALGTGDLRDDDLPGAPGEPGHSWLGLVQYNLVTMVSAMGGSPLALQSFITDDVTPDRATYPQ